MDDATLLEEIQAGPLAAELAPLVSARADNLITAALNQVRDGVDYQIRIKVDRRAILKVLSDRNKILSLYTAAEDPAHIARSAAWHTFWVLNHNDFSQIDLGDPAAEAKINDLVAGGVLTAEDVSALQALGLRQGSRVEVLEGEGAQVTLEQVTRVLNWVTN